VQRARVTLYSAGVIRNTLIIGLLGAWGMIGPGCTATPAPGPGSGTAGVGDMVDAWHAAAAQGQFDAYFSRMTRDAVFLGTDASERWTFDAFREFARPHFDGVEAWTYRPTTRFIASDPDRPGVAWFDEILVSEKYGTCRGTGVAVLDRGSWKIAHYSLTFPMPNELAGEMTAEIKAFEAAEHAAGR
jgi:hypothetical protein